MAVLITYWLLPRITDRLLSDAQRELLDLNGVYATLPTNSYVYWGLLAVWLSVYASVFLFLRRARAALVAVTGITFCATPFLGYVILTPIEATVSAVIGLLGGIIFGMAFFSPVSKEFGGRGTG